MNKLNKMKLEDFAKIYVNVAVSLAKKNLDSEVFDKKLSEIVSKTTGISREKIAKIHHPFYWVLFDEELNLHKNKQSKIILPMEYIANNPALLEMEDSRIFLNNNGELHREINVVNRIISEYADYIKSNVRCFQ